MCSAGLDLGAGVATGCPAALLLLGALSVVMAVLGTHLSGLGQGAAAALHFVGLHALMTAAVRAALEGPLTVTVCGAVLRTHPHTPGPPRTRSGLYNPLVRRFCSPANMKIHKDA